MDNIIKPNNYTPAINSDTVILANKIKVLQPKDKYLKVDKYLSEFKTQLDKEAARNNLDVYSKEEVNSKINISGDVYINDIPPEDNSYKLFVDTDEESESVEVYTKLETDSKFAEKILLDKASFITDIEEEYPLPETKASDTATKALLDWNGNNIVETYATKNDLSSKLNTLVSGTNIKTVNNQELLGQGNITFKEGIDPDDEDITNSNNKLKFADRAYDLSLFSGKGYKILRKNIKKVLDLTSIEYTLISGRTILSEIEYESDIYLGDVSSIMLNWIKDTNTSRIYGIADGKNYLNWTGRKYPVENYINENKPIEGKIYAYAPGEYYICKNEIISKYTLDNFPDAPSIELNILPNIEDNNTKYILKYDFYLDKDLILGNNSIIIGDGGSINCRGFKISSLKSKNLKLLNYLNWKTFNDKYSGIDYSWNKNLIAENINFPDLGFYSIDTIILDDFIKSEDFVTLYSKRIVNLSNVIERIDKSIPHNLRNKINIVCKSSNTFILYKPFNIRYNIFYDFNDSNIYINNEFIPDEDLCVIKYESYSDITNNVKGCIKNLKIDFSNARNLSIKYAFYLKNFNGELNNIYIQLADLDIFAFYLPFGSYLVSYSDCKKIINCSVRFNSSQNNPKSKFRTVFRMGDGCIIELSNLGGVAILGGNSYTIKGCLNDRYLLYDTSVDFSGSYWEIGQFIILNSNVKFDCCKLLIDNLISTNRNYTGNAFNIDSLESYEIVKEYLSVISEETDYYNEFYASKKPYSNVLFGPNMVCDFTYWNYLNSISGHILSIGDYSKVIGLENLISRTSYLTKDGTCFTIIPTINSKKFINDVSNIDVTNSTFNVSIENVTTNLSSNYEFHGVNWDSLELEEGFEISLFGCLSENRKLYFEIDRNKYIQPVYGNWINIKVLLDSVYPKELRIKIILKQRDKHYIYLSHNIKEINNKTFNLNTNTWNNKDIETLSISEQITKCSNGITEYSGTYNLWIEDNELSNELLNLNFNSCKKVEIISDNNIRAYLSKIPEYGEWSNGDEIVIETNGIYRYYNKWIKFIDLSN